MTTRIKYKREGKNFTSKYLTNFEGKRFQVYIDRVPSGIRSGIYLIILDQEGNVLDRVYATSVLLAKRKARELLINKYNVQLNEEIRPRK